MCDGETLAAENRARGPVRRGDPHEVVTAEQFHQCNLGRRGELSPRRKQGLVGRFGPQEAGVQREYPAAPATVVRAFRRVSFGVFIFRLPWIALLL